MSDFEAIQDFLLPQIRELGCNVEVEPGAWGVFSVPAADAGGNEIARALLSSASFPFECGTSVDDKWTLYYVREADRANAIAWLDDWTKRLSGEILPLSAAQRRLLADLPGSAAPHRIAQQFVDGHRRNEVSAGIVNEPPLVRALLDRLHQREPLFFSAFRLLITNHLIDMIELLRQIIPEDIQLKNELIKGSVSRDPFMNSRQEATAQIHQMMTTFFIINPLDQQKNTAILNPYAAYFDLVRSGDDLIAFIDGTNIRISPANLVDAIRRTRRRVYAGGRTADLQTHAPWVTAEIANPLRFIRARLAMHRDLSDLDGLYMLERAVTG